MSKLSLWIFLGIPLILSLTGGAPPTALAGPALQIWPEEVVLVGAESHQQLIATLVDEKGRARDVTSEAAYSSSDPAVIRVNSQGRVEAAGDGAAEVTVEAKGIRAARAVTARQAAVLSPLHFGNEIIPILTKYSCNSGGCHGKADGQNGFKLSLLGFDPAFDYDVIVNDSRGRRVFPAAPEYSLLLRKPAGEMPHGGGMRFPPDSDDYRKIQRWIRSGMPFGDPNAPAVARLEVMPAERLLDRSGRQQLAATAVYTDGRREDVTRLAQFESNGKELATANETGLVAANDLTGETSVMVRYQGQVTVFRAMIPLDVEIAKWPDFPIRNFIDQHIDRKLRLLGVPPSDPCSDGEFLRRAWFDLCGTMPPLDEVSRFAADPDPQKRAKLIDRLLERPEYAGYFALKWGDILRIRREGNSNKMRGTYAFHEWIHQSFEENKPYDQFVREILTAAGELRLNPPVAWYREVTTPVLMADDVAQVFLGTRIQCAQCHHHPFEKWSQNDYYGMVSFFARLGRKTPNGSASEPMVYTQRGGEARNPRTSQSIPPRPLDGPVMQVPPGDDPRIQLAKWMTSPGNPYFAKAIANRLWAHFFGIGIVEPLDDMRATNPPSHPELLEELARDFEASRYDLKHLIRTVCASQTYQLSSIPNAWNAKDKNTFSRYFPKRLQAEVLYDAIHQFVGAPIQFGGLPPGTRAIELPDEAFPSAFLQLFGKPRRVSSCECERTSEASLAQSLHLINSEELFKKIGGKDSRVDKLLADSRPDDEKVRELYRLSYARDPGAEELAAALAYLSAKDREKRQGYEDLVWVFINTKEFQFNH